MDLLTFLGLFMGALAVWFTLSKGNIAGLIINGPAFVLVVGGTLASTIMTYPWSVIKRAPKTVLFMFFPPKQLVAGEVIDRIVEFSEIATLRGVDSLPEQLGDEDDEYLRSGVKMLINDWDESTIRQVMTQEIEALVERHQQVQKVFISMGGYAPVYGLLGTLVGVLGLLRYLGDPSAMGAAMTVAIVTTFYGIFYANFIAMPIAGKLDAYTSIESLGKQLMMEGIICIKQELYPYMVRERLEKTVAAAIRKQD